MGSALNDVQLLAFTRVSFKYPGRRAEVVSLARRERFGDQGAARIDQTLALVSQPRGVTVSELQLLYPVMNPHERNRLARLVTEWRRFRSDVRRRISLPLDDIEPVFASPRSALNPKFFDATCFGGED